MRASEATSSGAFVHTPLRPFSINASPFLFPLTGTAACVPPAADIAPISLASISKAARGKWPNPLTIRISDRTITVAVNLDADRAVAIERSEGIESPEWKPVGTLSGQESLCLQQESAKIGLFRARPVSKAE